MTAPVQAGRHREAAERPRSLGEPRLSWEDSAASEVSLSAASPERESVTDLSRSEALSGPQDNPFTIEGLDLSIDDLAASDEVDEETVSERPAAEDSEVSRPPSEARWSESVPGLGAETTRRYEILQELGRGGMAVVYKARDRALSRVVALKFLSPALVGDVVAMRLFAREARAAATLNHPGIVTIYDIGILDGRPLISMEFIEGADLRECLRGEGPLPIKRALDITLQLTEALEYAHENKVIHRDIKPANVIVTTEGRVKILDFGVAKALQKGKMTASMFAGTPQYMAPEQLAKRRIDGRSDIFSLGVLLYQTLTGKRPFRGAERFSNVIPPSSHVMTIPEELDEVVFKALAVDPSERYQCAAAMRADLKAIERLELGDGATIVG